MRTRAPLSLPAALAAAPLLLGAPPGAAPQTFQGPPREGRDYIYAGPRLLAVADPTQASITVELPEEPLTIPEGGGPAAAAYAYEIVLPNRTQVRLRQNFDPQGVSTLVSLLGAPC